MWRELEGLEGAGVEVGHVAAADGLCGWNACLGVSPKRDLTPTDISLYSVRILFVRNEMRIEWRLSAVVLVNVNELF